MYCGGREGEYRNLLKNFTGWCRRNQLQLNTARTKEMVVDFQRPSPSSQPVNIKEVEVEVIGSYKYLGLELGFKLDWSANTDLLNRRG